MDRHDSAALELGLARKGWGKVKLPLVVHLLGLPQVIRPVRQLDDGDWLVLVRILETGEEAEYRYTHLMEDPKAA